MSDVTRRGCRHRHCSRILRASSIVPKGPKSGQAGAATSTALGEATVLTARKQLDPQHWPGGVPPMQRHFRSSLAWRLCLVAEGRFDAMLTFRETFEWDVAAGALIAAEAGAAVTDAQGLAFRFNAPSGLQRGVIAAPAALHARIMAHRAPGGTGAAAPGGASD